MGVDTQISLGNLIGVYENIFKQENSQDAFEALLDSDESILKDYFSIISQVERAKKTLPKGEELTTRLNELSEQLRSFFEKQGSALENIDDLENTSDNDLRNNLHLQAILYLKAHALATYGFNDDFTITGFANTISKKYQATQERVNRILESLEKVGFGPANYHIAEMIEDKTDVSPSSVEGAKLGDLRCQSALVERYLSIVSGTVMGTGQEKDTLSFPEQITEAQVIKWAHDSRNSHLPEPVSKIGNFLTNAFSAARSLHQPERKGVTQDQKARLNKMINLAKQISGDPQVYKMFDALLNFDTQGRDYSEFKTDLERMNDEFDSYINNQWAKAHKISKQDITDTMQRESTQNAIDACSRIGVMNQRLEDYKEKSQSSSSLKRFFKKTGKSVSNAKKGKVRQSQVREIQKYLNQIDKDPKGEMHGAALAYAKIDSVIDDINKEKNVFKSDLLKLCKQFQKDLKEEFGGEGFDAMVDRAKSEKKAELADQAPSKNELHKSKIQQPVNPTLSAPSFNVQTSAPSGDPQTVSPTPSDEAHTPIQDRPRSNSLLIAKHRSSGPNDPQLPPGAELQQELVDNLVHDCQQAAKNLRNGIETEKHSPYKTDGFNATTNGYSHKLIGQLEYVARTLKEHPNQGERLMTELGLNLDNPTWKEGKEILSNYIKQYQSLDNQKEQTSDLKSTSPKPTK